MKSFKSFIMEENETKKPDPSINTQVATTGGTYEKTGSHLAPHLQPGSKILSLGAGLDHTREALKKGLGEAHKNTEVHDMEPNPQRRKTEPEYTSSDQIPHDHYHATVSHNVLNVVEPEVRHHVVKTAFDSTKEGGHIVFGARKWKGDVDLAKNAKPGSEPKSIWVSRDKGKTQNYQKGFDGDELKSYIEERAKKEGHQVEVKKLPGIAATAVHVRIIKKAK